MIDVLRFLRTRIAADERLDGLAGALQEKAERALPRGAVTNALSGTWLGHPLHSALTDIPMGAWAAAAILDLADAAGIRAARRSADSAAWIGLGGAVAAAGAGINDWRFTDGASRRIGLVHGLLNGAATVVYLASLLARLAGLRRTGRFLGWGGFAMANASGYLGGTMVFDERMGVNHAPERLPREWTAVVSEDVLVDGEPFGALAGDVNVVLVRVQGEVLALADQCSHLGGPLSAGEVDGERITCPWHGSVFCLRDGRALAGPTAYDQPTLETRIRDGQVELRAAS